MVKMMRLPLLMPAGKPFEIERASSAPTDQPHSVPVSADHMDLAAGSLYQCQALDHPIVRVLLEAAAAVAEAGAPPREHLRLLERGWRRRFGRRQGAA